MPRKPAFEPTLLSRATGSVLREVMTESAGSIQAFCERHGLDRRNLGRVIAGTRDVQRGVLYTYLTLAEVDVPRFELRVEERMRQLSARETPHSTPDTAPHMK